MESYKQLLGTRTAAAMSEEAKNKSAGKSAHHKKKGKKVKETLSSTWLCKQHGVAASGEAKLIVSNSD